MANGGWLKGITIGNNRNIPTFLKLISSLLYYRYTLFYEKNTFAFHYIVR